MTTLFLTVLRMSATASVAIAAVLLTRLLLRKAPKKYAYLLWTVVGFRLICPVSLHSAFSLFSLRTPTAPPAMPSPAAPFSPPPVTVQAVPAIGTPPVSPEISLISPPSAPLAVNWLTVWALIWIIGMVLLAGYSVCKELRLRRILATATVLEDNVYCSEAVRSPFVLGVIRPRIYIPYGLTDEVRRYVLAHEQCHLRRLDHITRRIAFLLLTLHWFNPLCYLAFSLCGKDMELSCDEAVLRQGNISKQAYSTTLLSFAAGHRMFAPAPLAFGETGVKSRITNALRWKQPRIWVSLIAAFLCLAVLLSCGLDPKAPQEDDDTFREAIQLDAPDGSAVLYFQPTGEKELGLFQITEPDGTTRIKFPVSFQDASGATSAQDPLWLDSGAIAVTCHINPSAEYFLVYDAADGHLLNGVLGNDFLPVPGTRDILYAQSGPHFSDAQVPRLLVNDQELYRGSEPGSFFYDLVLSPDSRSLTFQLRSSEADVPETTINGVYDPAKKALVDITTSQFFPFEDILGFSGYYQDFYQSPFFVERTYYARTEDGDFPIGHSFGGNDDHVADLDGDGVAELICNCVYGADGAQRVYLYTNRDGQILQGTLDPTLPADYENWGVNSTAEQYDPDTRTFQLLYSRADKSTGKQEYTMQDFRFVPFVPDHRSRITPGTTVFLQDGLPYAAAQDGTFPLCSTPLSAPPEWAHQDLAGRKTAKSLAGSNPEVTGQFVTSSTGWLAVTYGAGVAHADTYIYQTWDGGARWSYMGTPPITWHPGPICFVDESCAVVSQRMFNGAPAYITWDRGQHWKQLSLPTPGSQVESITFDGTNLQMSVRESSAAWALLSSDRGRHWTTTEVQAAPAPLLLAALQQLHGSDDWSYLSVSAQRVGVMQAGKPSVQPVMTPVPLLQQLSDQLLPANSREHGSGIHLQLVWEGKKLSVELWPSDQTPGRVLLRYHGPGDSAQDQQDAAAQHEALYLWLLALQSGEAVELHDLDEDGFVETLLFGKGGRLTIYDWYDHSPQVIDVSQQLGKQAQFIGLVANIGDEYRNSFGAHSPDGEMLYAYRDGTFTKLCTFREAQDRYFREISQAAGTA